MQNPPVLLLWDEMPAAAGDAGGGAYTPSPEGEVPLAGAVSELLTLMAAAKHASPW
jgi:hypothetical protein